MNLYFKEINSPVGILKLVANEKALVAILWENEKLGRVRLEAMKRSDNHQILVNTQAQLTEYFKGKRKIFDLPLEAFGTTFQHQVWSELCEIPFGQTRSYGDLAKKIGSPNASRAVGAANGKNPISIVVPCHRVIGKKGKLTGFAGGLKIKKILLNLESHHQA